MKKEYAVLTQAALTTVGAFLSAKLGILFPVLCILACMMIMDYISGIENASRHHIRGLTGSAESVSSSSEPLR